MARELIEIEEARRLVLERAAPLGDVERLSLADALGRVLAEPVESADPVPGFDNSAMDGYAVRASDTSGAAADRPAELAVVDESRAGRPAARGLGAGEAIAISTGAMVPEGADAVVRVEDTRPLDAGRADATVAVGEPVAVLAEVDPGRDIRRSGEDVEPGTRLLEPGTEIGPAELGVIASVGLADVACARRPRVSVLTTGDELQPPGEPLRPGAIRNSNAHAVPPLVVRAGAEVAAVETVGDERAAT
ncbi:MAG: molybdopterin molybdotransferase MoeA, partial [Solirubrobacterales bacterium]